MKGWRILALALLLVAGPALGADGWYGNPDGAGSTIKTLEVSQTNLVSTAFFLISESASIGDLSTVLTTEQARSLELTLITDTGGTAGTCEVRVYESFSHAGATVAAVTGIPQISNAVDGDGVQDDLSLDGASANRRSIRGFMAYGLVVEVVVPPAAGEQCALKAQARR